MFQGVKIRTVGKYSRRFSTKENPNDRAEVTQQLESKAEFQERKVRASINADGKEQAQKGNGTSAVVNRGTH